jgi:hypothetical protein
MARTAITTTTLVPNGSVLNPATTAVDQANGMNVAIPSAAFPSAPDMDHLILVIAATGASPFNAIVRAGIGGAAVPGAAFRSGLGDLTISVTNATTRWFGPFDPSRFMQTDGSLNLDFGVGFTGTVAAVLVPVRW